MRYLLDTNLVSDLIRNHGVAQRNIQDKLANRRSVPASSSLRNCDMAPQKSFATAHETGRSGAIVLARDSPLARCLVAPLTSLAVAAPHL
jgi:hypothetical protein